MIKYLYRFFLILAWIPISSEIQAQIPLQRLAKDIMRTDSAFYRQKIFLHINKNKFLSGETLWYKVYAIQAGTLLPDTSQTSLFIDFYNPSDLKIFTQKLRLKNGTAYAELKLPDSLSGGRYNVRVYTVSMQNFDQSLLFTKPFEVFNPKKYFFTPTLLKKAKTAKKNAKHFLIDFFQQDDSANFVFYASNKNGKPISVKGFITDNHKNIVTTLKSNRYGFGNFTFTPVAGKEYYAQILDSAKRKLKIKLTFSEKKSCVMRIDSVKLGYDIKLHNNRPPTDDVNSLTYTLVCRTLGHLISAKPIYFDAPEKTIHYDYSKLPAGILHFTLFDADKKPVSEQMVFNSAHNNYHIKSEFSILNDTLFLSLSSDNEGDTLNISTSVLFAPQRIENNDAVNIYNYLYFSSELNRQKYNPKLFPETLPTSSSVQNNYFLQCFGIRENLAEMFKISHSQFVDEKGFSINGYVTHEIIKYPAADIALTMYILNKANDRISSRTDSEGNFSFGGLNYNDTLDVLIEGRTHRDGKMLILYNRKSDFSFSPQLTLFDPKNEIKLLKSGRKYINKHYNYSQPQDSFHIKRPSLHSHADRVIDFNKISTAGYNDAFQVIEDYIPGFELGKDNALRGRNSFFQSSEPLYLIDDIPADKQAVASIPASDVERIEILKSPGTTAIYGSRAANGIIAVYTKVGFNVKRGEIHLKILGYYSSRIFTQLKNAEPANGLNDACIDWIPELKLTTDNPQKLKIALLPNQKGFVKIVIQGISSKGTPVAEEKQITIE